MKDSVVIANTSHLAAEINIPALGLCQAHELSYVTLFGGGSLIGGPGESSPVGRAPLNCCTAEGHPAAVMDMASRTKRYPQVLVTAEKR